MSAALAAFRVVDSPREISLGAAQRVLILGCPGSGKTTVARALAARSGLPRTSVDDLYWKAGWQRPSRPEFEARLRRFIDEDRWILDGNYADSIDCRLARADTVIWIDAPSLVCLRRVLLRTLMRALGARTSLPREVALDPSYRARLHLDFGFLRYVARFEREVRPALLQRLERLPVPGGRYFLRNRTWS